jgi:hypothetical protein
VQKIVKQDHIVWGATEHIKRTKRGFKEALQPDNAFYLN